MIKRNIIFKKLFAIWTILFLLVASFISSSNAVKIKTFSKNIGKDIVTNTLGDCKIFVKIKEIKALENPDPWPWAAAADFKVMVNIDGSTYSKSFESDKNHIYPNWVATHSFEYKEKMSISIKLIDRDPDTDDVCDINPRVGVKSCSVVYNVNEGSWGGDDGGTGHLKGDGKDKPQCEIWFEIWDECSDKLKADAGGPYRAKVGEEVQLHGSATGGYPPYRWYWSFCKNGKKIGGANVQNPVAKFYSAGKIDVYLTVYDDKGNYDDDYTTLTIFEKEKKNKYVVLVSGGDGLGDISWWPNDRADDEDFEEETQYAYETFRNLGYSDDNIYYLSGKSIKNGGDAVTTKDNVKYAITKWLKSRSDENSDVFIFIAGHGAYFPKFGSVVAVYPGRPWNIWEVVMSKEMALWLSDLKYSTCIVVIEACQSGGFISDLSGRNRIIMTATDEFSLAYCGSFPYPFFGELRKTSDTYKPSYGDAWMAADKRVDGSSPDEQNPLIDDNGDRGGYGDGNVNLLPNDKDGDGEYDPGEDGWLAIQTFP